MRRVARRVLFVSMMLAAALAHAGDWPSLRGPHSDGSTTSAAAFAKAGLDLIWKRPIGPGYRSWRAEADAILSFLLR